MGVVGGHAVVIGGAISGLVAARTLASRFERVTVIDRDELPVEPRNRDGVPHGAHPHLLLISGRLALEKLFPGLTEELIAGGAVPFDPGQDLLFVHGGGQRVRFPTEMQGISLSRVYLESTLRARVRALRNVELRGRAEACGLVGGRGRVTGVQVEGAEPIEADLVVDASGRTGGRGDRWLEQLGYPAPDVATVKMKVGYSTRLYRRTDDDLPDGGVACLIAPFAPHQRRAGVALPIEGDRWILAVGEWHGDRMPDTPEGFQRFIESLPVSYLADLAKRAEPIGDVLTRAFPASQRRYFERVRRLPAGYLAIGDAICSFNPLYGQGMTVAALEALELGDCLDRFGAVSVDLAREYYRATGRVIDTPWTMATGGDFAYPETTGRKPFGIDLLNGYMGKAILAAHVSPAVHRVLIEVQHLLKPPSALLRPGTVVRALRGARRSPARLPRSPEPAVTVPAPAKPPATESAAAPGAPAAASESTAPESTAPESTAPESTAPGSTAAPTAPAVAASAPAEPAGDAAPPAGPRP
ncbi:hypothetical protein AB0J86_26335 [Micromonospora sp. NPDC049559]|uniref:NAD(P)/FAD-dependent oxidoreductase n=1 Tax=Micromonospora sp. NPDC049559 TaxID=3155923 RepID=UPI00341FBB00